MERLLQDSNQRSLEGCSEDDLRPLQQQIAGYLADTNLDDWEKNDTIIVESAVHKNLVQTARRMKRDGMDVQKIARYTGLATEEIEDL